MRVDLRADANADANADADAVQMTLIDTLVGVAGPEAHAETERDVSTTSLPTVEDAHPYADARADEIPDARPEEDDRPRADARATRAYAIPNARADTPAVALPDVAPDAALDVRADVRADEAVAPVMTKTHRRRRPR